MELYDEMNEKIIKILRLGEPDNMQLYAAQLIETLLEENKRLRFMVENGLGWEDVINDIPDAYQPK